VALGMMLYLAMVEFIMVFDFQVDLGRAVFIVVVAAIEVTII